VVAAFARGGSTPDAMKRSSFSVLFAGAFGGLALPAAGCATAPPAASVASPPTATSDDAVMKRWSEEVPKKISHCIVSARGGEGAETHGSVFVAPDGAGKIRDVEIRVFEGNLSQSEEECIRAAAFAFDGTFAFRGKRNAAEFRYATNVQKAWGKKVRFVVAACAEKESLAGRCVAGEYEVRSSSADDGKVVNVEIVALRGTVSKDTEACIVSGLMGLPLPPPLAGGDPVPVRAALFAKGGCH
jgi:hypothetical protein